MKIEHICAKKRCNWNIHSDSETKWMDFHEKFLFLAEKGDRDTPFPKHRQSDPQDLFPGAVRCGCLFQSMETESFLFMLGRANWMPGQRPEFSFPDRRGGRGVCACRQPSVPIRRLCIFSSLLFYSFLYLFFSFLYWGRQTATSRHPDGNQPATGRKQNRWVAERADSRLFAVSYAKLHNSPFVHLCRYAKKPCAGAFFVDKAEGNWYP